MSPRTEPLRILVVANAEPWPLDSGARLHVFHVVRQLARHGAVTLLLPSPPAYPERIPAGVRVVCPNGTADVPPDRGRVPFLWRWARRHFGWQPALGAWLSRNAHRGSFDVTVLHGPRGALYIPCCTTPVVWDVQDELTLPLLRDLPLSRGRERWRLLRRLPLYIAFERAALRRAAATVCVAPTDAAYARRWAPRARVVVIPNGVDLEYFRPDATLPQPGIVTFVGALDFAPNVDGVCWFVDRVWPHLQASDPTRRLRVVGRAPVPQVHRLAAVPGVEVIPDVADVRPWLGQAQVVVVPVRTGGGLKNKVLEACALARPVVATSRALSGLSARRGCDVLVADSPKAWVTQIERLLRCPAYAARIAQNGYAWVRRKHHWADTGRQFLELLTEVVSLPVIRGHPEALPAPEALDGAPSPLREGRGGRSQSAVRKPLRAFPQKWGGALAAAPRPDDGGMHDTPREAVCH